MMRLSRTYRGLNACFVPTRPTGFGPTWIFRHFFNEMSHNTLMICSAEPERVAPGGVEQLSLGIASASTNSSCGLPLSLNDARCC